MADLLVWATDVGVQRTTAGFEASDGDAVSSVAVRVLAAFCEPADPDRVAPALAQRFGAPIDRVAQVITDLRRRGLLAAPTTRPIERAGRVQPPFAARAAHGGVVLVDIHHRTLYDASSDLDGDTGDAAALALLRRDGFTVRPFDASYGELPDTPRAVLFVHGLRPTRSGRALDDAEVDALVRWIDGGGAALVVAGHEPNEPGLAPLFAALGLGLRGGHAHHPDHRNPQGGRCSWFTLRRGDGVCDHAITTTLPLATVGYYCGGALTCAPEHAVLRFPTGTTASAEPTTHAEALFGMCALPLGRGRVAVTLDRGIFRCQEVETAEGIVHLTLGDPGLDNAALFVATMRWLAQR
jgi:hypothetical protein